MSVALSSRCNARFVATSARCIIPPQKRLDHQGRSIAARVKVEVTANHDWVPALASGLFVGVKQGLFEFSTNQLRTILAVAVLALPVVNVLIRKENYDWVSSALAPSALAADVLSILPAVPAAVVAFGTKLCRDLATFTNMSGSFYALLATLGVAVYYNKAVVWFCAGWASLYGAKFFTALRDESKVMIIPGVFSALLVAALVKYVQTNSMSMLSEVTVCIIAAQVAWSIFTTGRAFANEADS